MLTLERLNKVMLKPRCIDEELVLDPDKGYTMRKSIYYMPDTEEFIIFKGGEQVNESLLEESAIKYYNEIEL